MSDQSHISATPANSQLTMILDTEHVRYPPTVGRVIDRLSANKVLVFACPYKKSDHVVRVYAYLVYGGEWVTWSRRIPDFAAIRENKEVYAASFSDGKIILCSGRPPDEYGKTILFNPDAEKDEFEVFVFEDEWQRASDKLYALGASFVSFNNMAVRIGGLYPDRGLVNTISIFNKKESEWSTFQGSERNPITAYNATAVCKNGEMLVTGGLVFNGGSSGTPTSACIAMTVSDTGFKTRKIASMTRPRAYHAACTLDNGMVFACGGCEIDTDSPNTSAELYDPDKDKWTFVATMDYTRMKHHCVALPGNRVLVIGGEWWYSPSDTTETTCEIFDFKTRKFSRTDSIPETIVNFACVPSFVNK